MVDNKCSFISLQMTDPCGMYTLLADEDEAQCEYL